MSTDPTPEAVEELRKILADHWAAGMARSGAPAEWECVCDVALEMSDEAHQAHTAREVLAAGWVSPGEHAAVTANGNWQAENGAKYMGLYGRLYNRIDGLAGELEAADSGSNAADYRLGRFVVSEIRGILSGLQDEQTRIANGDDEPPALEAS